MAAGCFACRNPLWPRFERRLSLKAKIRVLSELFIRRGALEDETLSSFVRRRLGPEMLDYLIDPFVGGVYAGDPDRLSVTHAFPKLHALEQTFGSLIKGSILGAMARRKRGVASKVSAPMLTFETGLGVIVEALQTQLRGALNLESVVTAVSRDSGGWTVKTSAGAAHRHSAVLLCAPAYRVAGINIDGVPQPDLAPLREIYYPPVARVAVGFRRDRISHALDGFGVLIPSKEKMNTLGILFSSSLFPNRAPQGYALLTAYLGGSRGRDTVNTSDAGLIELALTDIGKLLGTSGPPVFEDVVRIPRSIPQYNVGYKVVKDAIGKLETQTPGVFIASSYRHGISVADCIVGGRAASEKVQRYIADA